MHVSLEKLQWQNFDIFSSMLLMYVAKFVDSLARISCITLDMYNRSTVQYSSTLFDIIILPDIF